MTRTQISMEREMLRRAKRRAARLGVSLAEYIRTLIDRDLGTEPSSGDPSILFDLGDSGGSDVARTKDRMLGAAVEEESGLRG